MTKLQLRATMQNNNACCILYIN